MSKQYNKSKAIYKDISIRLSNGKTVDVYKLEKPAMINSTSIKSLNNFAKEGGTNG